MSKLKVGIIGTGNISHFHLEGYKNDPEVEILALCDIIRERAEKKAEKYNVASENVFTDYREMLKLEELDAVSICTPNNVHADAAICALNAKKHVLCEKPMAVNALQAEEMREAAKGNEKLLMIGFVRRFGNDTKVLKDFIDAGTMGDLYFGKASYLRRSGCPGGWFGNKELAGGGPLIDLGVHMIDLLRYLMGNHRCESVYGVTFDSIGLRNNAAALKGYVSADQDGVFNVEDFASAIIRFSNKSAIHIETSFNLNVKNDSTSFEIFGDKAGARISPGVEIFGELNGYPVDLTPVGNTALDFNTVFNNEISHFVDCILNGSACISPAKDGVELMKIIDAIYLSAKTGREVIL